MAPDNVTTLSTLEAEEKKTEPDNVEEVKKTKEEQKTYDDDVEEITIEREPKVENLSEKMEDEKDKEKKEIAEALANIIEKNVEELVEKDAVPNVDKRKQDEPYVTEGTKENNPIVCETHPVLVDEIDMKKEVEIKEKEEEEKSKAGCVKETVEPLKIEENAVGVEKDEEAAENEKQETMEAVEIKENTMGTLETKENGETNDPSTIGTKDPENHAQEEAKTESTDEKTVDETKLADSSAKEEVKNSPKQSNNLMGKVKKSFMKAKKAISWKHNSNTKNNETKEDEKA